MVSVGFDDKNSSGQAEKLEECKPVPEAGVLANRAGEQQQWVRGAHSGRVVGTQHMSNSTW